MSSKAVHVYLDNAPDVPDDELAGYVVEAIETWGGQHHPADPLFYRTPVKKVIIGSMEYINPER